MGQDEQGAATLFEEVADAWKRNDGAALGETFTDDGTLINPFGQRADGRAAVSAMYTEYFGGMLGGTTTAVTLESLRAVGTTHAFVDAEQVIRTGSGDVLLVVHLAALLRREGDGWRFADCRPYTIAPTP